MGNLAPGNVRLSKYHREAIAKKVLHYKFQNSSNLLKSLETEHRNLARAVYDAAFSQADRAKMDALPKGWLYEDGDVKARFGGEVSSLNYNGSLYALRGADYSLLTQMGYSRPDDLELRIPYDQHFSVIEVFDHDHPITARFNSLRNRFTTMIEEARKAKAVLYSALQSSTTSNSLIKAWPEVEPFVRQVIGNRGTQVVTALSVPVATLNETFGLPVPA
jgi:hypothetical protein